jgi:AcrR family transcriptional regulator
MSEHSLMEVFYMAKDDDSYDLQEYLKEHIKDYPDKEVRILNAAINTFSEKGFERTKTKEIAKMAGVAEGTIFRYFPTKDAILERMVPLLFKIMQPRIEMPIKNIIEDTKGEPVDVIYTTIILDRIKLIRDNERFLLSVLPALIHRAPLMNQFKERILPIIKKYLTQVLDAAKARGEIREDVDPEIAMDQFVGFIVAYCYISGYEDEEKIEGDVRTFINFVMKGWRR